MIHYVMFKSIARSKVQLLQYDAYRPASRGECGERGRRTYGNRQRRRQAKKRKKLISYRWSVDNYICTKTAIVIVVTVTVYLTLSLSNYNNYVALNYM